MAEPLLCPRCGIKLAGAGLGRYVCPDGHGEWLTDDEVETLDEYDSDPYRQEKTIASQLREYGTNSESAGKAKDLPTQKPKPWEVE